MNHNTKNCRIYVQFYKKVLYQLLRVYEAALKFGLSSGKWYFMKSSVLLLFLQALTFLACTKEDIGRPIEVKDNLAIQTVYGTWKLISREDYRTNQAFYKDFSDAQGYCNGLRSCDILLMFYKIDATDSITGHTINIEVFGSFSFDQQTRTFHTLEFGGTKMGEPHWADNVWNYIYLIESYAVNEHYLRLYFNNKHQSLTFRKQ